MKLRIYIIGLIVLLSCGSGHDHFYTDKAFILISETESPDKRFKIVEYKFDLGGLDYSRAFWALTPSDNKNLNLGNYLLPDGYKALSWTSKNEAIIKKWQPYYYKDKEIDLKTGDIFNQVKVRVK